MAELSVHAFTGLAMVSCQNCSWWDELDDMTPEFVHEWHDTVVAAEDVPEVGPCPGFQRSMLWNIGSGFDYILNTNHAETRWEGVLVRRWYASGPAVADGFVQASLKLWKRLHGSDVLEQLVEAGRVEEVLPWYLDHPWRSTIRSMCRENGLQVNTFSRCVSFTRRRLIATSSGPRS